MTKILVAEDDTTLAEGLVYNLRRERYDTVVAGTGLQAVVAARSERPDLILLDLMLPEIDGLEACRIIRAESTVPIIMLTARDAEMDSVLGLEMGADDYVTKPFRLRELLARVRAVLRRPSHATVDAIAIGPIEISVSARSVQRDGKPIHLLPREFDLLTYLMHHPGTVFTRSHLLDAVWEGSYLGDSRTVDVHIRRLRAKLEDDPSVPKCIRTVHGVGYVFDGS